MEEVSTINTIIRTALGLGWIQWGAFLFSIIYVILAAAENIWCWFFGIISVILMFLVCIDPDVRYYSDAVLQVIYFVMSIYGWWKWRQHRNNVEGEILDAPLKDNAGQLSIIRWPAQNHLIAIAVGTVLAFIMGWFWGWMGANLPYIDAFTTAFSVIATIMVAQKVLENWLYWIVIDVVYIFMYGHRGVYLFSILFFLYTVIAVVGYLKWKRQLAVSSNSL